MSLFAASPHKNLTLSRLAELRKSDYYNGDTGTELAHDEAEARYFELIESKSAKNKPWQYGDESFASDCPFAFFNESELKMGVTIKDMDTEETGAGSLSDKVKHSIDIAQMMIEVNQQVQIATGEAVEKAMTYAESLSRDIIAKTKEQISGIAKPKIMMVEVDKVQRKLKKPANKHLGRLIVNHGLRIHTMLVGPAGCGKTIAAEQVAEATGKQFGSVCLSAGASETWLFGRQTPNGFVEAPFSRLYREGGIFLLDEMDAADSNLLLSINTALANGFMFNPISGDTIQQHEDFVCIAGANTFGMGANASYTGRNRLDGATLTRFVKIAVDYDPEIEEVVCPDEELREALQKARGVIAKERMEYIISTRCLDQAYRQKAAGITNAEIVDSLTLGWPTELVAKTGLTDFVTQKSEKRGRGKAKGQSEFMPPAAGELF